MAGGQLTIDIPAGWEIVKKVNDADTLFDESTLFDDVVIGIEWMVELYTYTSAMVLIVLTRYCWVRPAQRLYISTPMPDKAALADVDNRGSDKGYTWFQLV